MNAWLQSETFWLDLTNLALGAVTLICLAVVASGVVKELLPRLRHGAVRDIHALLTPDLGLTMADGGRRTERKRTPFWRRWRR